ncbi:MAG: methyltransferase domain-containing protein [Pseudomonadota bacterium]
MTLGPSNIGYTKEAPDLLKRYESFSGDQVHAHWRALFPAPPGRVLDIGAGTGRDAAWFASLGYDVLAVEPTDALRDGAQALHPEPEITWLDDRLPDLPHVVAGNQTYDMVMMNAVWMHLTADERAHGLSVIAALMNPGSRLFMSQRHGPIPEGRRMFDVTGEETITRGAELNLSVLFHQRSGSILGENRKRGVEWTCLVFEKT